MSTDQFLDGIRVVTMAQYVPGPLAAARLKRAGADVIKIEPPAGDPMLPISAAWHAEMHHGIPIERLDLRTETDRARMITLLRDTDLFVTSQRPSALARLRLDPDSLRSESTKVRVLRIVGSVVAPEHAGHDLTYQAEAGTIDDRMPLTISADIMASERVFASALALLRQPPGAVMDVGIVESLEPLAASLRHGLTAPNGLLGGAAFRYRLYETKNGRIAVAALEPRFESRMYEQLGLPTDSDPSSRFLERTAEEWESWAHEWDLPIVALRAVPRDRALTPAPHPKA